MARLLHTAVSTAWRLCILWCHGFTSFIFIC